MNKYTVTINHTDDNGLVKERTTAYTTEWDAVRAIDLAHKYSNVELIDFSANIQIEKYRY